MTTPSQIAVEAAEEWYGDEMPYNSLLVSIMQFAIDKATAGKDAEIERLNAAVAGRNKELEACREMRNRAAMDERQKYIPMLAKMVPIEDVKPLLEALKCCFDAIGYPANGNSLQEKVIFEFKAIHGDKLK